MQADFQLYQPRSNKSSSYTAHILKWQYGLAMHLPLMQNGEEPISSDFGLFYLLADFFII
jgi:hypothetical protein